MKSLLLVLTVLITPFYSQAQDAKVWCDDQYSDEIREIDNSLVKRVDSCVADVVWGSKNVCFEGDAQALVDRINNGDYRWPALFAQDAQVSAEGLVVFTGVDQQNFYSSKMDIPACN